MRTTLGRVIVIATLAVAGCSASPGATSSAPEPSAAATQARPSVAARPKEFSALVDIGGRKLDVFCFGEAAAGVPTVVAESGLGGGWDSWRDILYGVVAKTRICAYDRAGLEDSDPSRGAD